MQKSSGQNPEEVAIQLRDKIELDLHDNFSSYAWIGLVAPDGTVMASTGDLLKGSNVAHRPWFQAASERPYLGDAHEALLLEKKLENTSNTPLRFVDVAVPLKNSQGNLTGILGAHLYLDWVANIGKSLLALYRNG